MGGSEGLLLGLAGDLLCSVTAVDPRHTERFAQTHSTLKGTFYDKIIKMGTAVAEAIKSSEVT